MVINHLLHPGMVLQVGLSSKRLFGWRALCPSSIPPDRVLTGLQFEGHGIGTEEGFQGHARLLLESMVSAPVGS